MRQGKGSDWIRQVPSYEQDIMVNGKTKRKTNEPKVRIPACNKRRTGRKRIKDKKPYKVLILLSRTYLTYPFHIPVHIP